MILQYFVIMLFIYHHSQGDIIQNFLIKNNSEKDVAADHKNYLEPSDHILKDIDPRFTCYKCESPCKNVGFCDNAIQCWKSTTRDSIGNERASRGCASSLEQMPFFCKPHPANSGPSKRKTRLYYIECCVGNFCNGGDFPYLQKSPNDMHFINIITSYQFELTVSILIIIIILGVIIIFYNYRSQFKKCLFNYHDSMTMNSSGNTFMEYLDSESSGSGLPLLIQRTLARQVTLVECVGRGGYGEVWKAVCHGGNIAVKIFYSLDEDSWKRETEIFSTTLLQHENILGYLGSDMISNNSCTQFWLMMEFFPQGSLYDHLNRTTLTKDEMIIIASSIVNGIIHLHTEIQGFGAKPAIAHRDLKSKNILIRMNGTCVIADFGLAVKYNKNSDNLNIGSNPRVGTRRYMAPEILDEIINMKVFESFTRADIYAFGLILWEICYRTLSNGIEEEFKIAYHDVVSSDPSFEEMRQVVCVNNYRPLIPKSWYLDPLFIGMSQIMSECWHKNPAVRLTAFRIKKSILKLANEKSVAMDSW